MKHLLIPIVCGVLAGCATYKAYEPAHEHYLVRRGGDVAEYKTEKECKDVLAKTKDKTGLYCEIRYETAPRSDVQAPGD